MRNWNTSSSSHITVTAYLTNGSTIRNVLIKGTENIICIVMFFFYYSSLNQIIKLCSHVHVGLKYANISHCKFVHAISKFAIHEIEICHI